MMDHTDGAAMWKFHHSEKLLLRAIPGLERESQSYTLCVVSDLVVPPKRQVFGSLVEVIDKDQIVEGVLKLFVNPPCISGSGNFPPCDRKFRQVHDDHVVVVNVYSPC